MFWQFQRKGVPLHPQRGAAESRWKCEQCTDLHTFCTRPLRFSNKYVEIRLILELHTFSTKTSTKNKRCNFNVASLVFFLPIYTDCYMFSNDQDEVADLFQEVLSNLWKSLPSFEGRSDVRVLKGTVNSDVSRHLNCSLAATKVETASTDDKTVPMDNKTASMDDKTETLFSSSSFCITIVPSVIQPPPGEATADQRRSRIVARRSACPAASAAGRGRGTDGRRPD